jgi:uncharacterized membrane protein
VRVWQLAVLFGVVVATCAYYTVRIVITYDRQKGLGDVARRRSVYFSIALGLLVVVLTLVFARS